MKPCPLTVAALLLVPLAAAGWGCTLAWNPNPEPDISHYTIYWATNLFHTITTATGFTNVGNVTTASVVNLPDGKRVWFRVTASNTSGLESDLSEYVFWPSNVVVVSQAIQVSASLSGPWSNVVSLTTTDFVWRMQQRFYRGVMSLQERPETSLVKSNSWDY